MSDYLSVKRIEFHVTYRCNSHCQHCHLGAKKRHTAPAAIDRLLAVEIVRKVTQRYHPSSVMTFGGEPLLYPDVVCDIHEAARTGGVPERQVITNAGSPRSESGARDVACRLATSGVNAISISVDSFHQEHIPLEIVERNVRAYAHAGIPHLAWNPCWVVSPSGDNVYDRDTRAILETLAHLPVEDSGGNILQPDGNAQAGLSSYLEPRTQMPTGSCEDVPYGGRLDRIESIGIEPNGDVTICWDWPIGNAVEEDVLAILDRYDPHSIPETEAILRGGMAALAELYRERGVDLDPEGYYSICDMCRSLRRAAM